MFFVNLIYETQSLILWVEEKFFLTDSGKNNETVNPIWNSSFCFFIFLSTCVFLFLNQISLKTEA